MHYLWDCKVGQLLWKAVWLLLKKFKLPNNLVIPLLSTHPKVKRDQRDYLYTHIHSSIIHNSQKVHYSSALKKQWTYATTCMNLEDIRPSEIGQSAKDKYYDSNYTRYLKQSTL